MTTSKSSQLRRNRLSLFSISSLRQETEKGIVSTDQKPEKGSFIKTETPEGQPDKGPVLLKAGRRKSRLDLLSSLIPLLNSPPAADLPSSQSIHRKPLPADSSPTSQDSIPPPYEHPDPTSITNTGTVGLGITAPTEAPPVPPKEPLTAMPNVIQKHRKVLSQPSQEPVPPLPLNGSRAATIPSTFQFNETPASPPRLKKSRDSSRGRLQPTRQPSPSPDSRGRSTSAQPTINRTTDSSRKVSSPAASRPTSSRSSDGNQSPDRRGESRGRLRRSWLPGGRSRSNSHDMSKGHTAAWIISPDSQVDYNTASLVNGEKVPELWNENGAVYVYMHPRGSGHGPSFKVPIEAIASSRVFNDLIQAEQSSPSARSGSRSFGDQLSVHDATRITLSPPDSPPLPEGEWRLYVPSSLIPDGKAPQVNQTASPSLERLVAIRNLFAFLMRQPLIGTKAHPSAFAAFLQIASLLAEFEFSSFDGVSYGEEADISFASFIEQLALADVRHSREKTIEALILGEQMRSWDLYNEAFTHAVGKYGYILDIKSPLFGKVSASTRQRLERANLDLQNRQQNVNIRLEEFDFPSLFAGVANSTSNDAYKSVRFKNWRTSFLKMRSFILGYYKDLFGNWPPKARSKKNPFSESGLNRLVLKALYADLCSLYDLLVDREAITPRVIDQLHEYSESESANPHISALRQMLSEFDASSPPVLPPIPFDVPKIPTMASVMATYDELSPKEQARFDRKLQPHELLLVLHKSYNFDTDSLETPFLMEFKDYDLKESKGTSSGDMLDHRIGTWLFLYVVIQSLPMLVVDAPGLKFTEGVEYFLCEPPQGNLPWMEDAGEVRKAWYQVPGQGIVELSADVIMYSVEATYNRSHCWLAAKQWEATGGSVPAIAPPPALSPLEAPRPVFQDMDAVGSPPSMSMDGGRRGSSSSLALRPRNASPDAGQAYRASVASIGLEPLPVPEGMPVDRRASRVLNGPFGLEPLPVPEGMPIDRRASRVYSGPFGDELSPYARPVSMAMPRSRSAGNLNAMMQEAAPQQQQQQNESKGRQASLGGSTFDDILKDLDNQKKPKKRFGF